VSLRRKLLVCALAPVLGVLLAEAVLRGLGLRPVPLPEARGSVLIPVDDEVLLFENRPNGLQVLLYREVPGAAPRRVEMRTNSQRFRGLEVALEKSVGTLRVACLGDSHTFGDGVGEGQAWPDHLRERALGEAPIEVLNCGVNAYDTLQEVLWFERRVAAFEPDVLLLAYFVNDVAARGVGVGGGGIDWLQKLVHPRRGGWVAGLRSRSRAVDLLFDGVYRRREKAAYTENLDRRYADDSPGWLRVQQALVRLRDACRGRGISLHVVLFPYVEATAGGFRSDLAFAKVREYCRSIQVGVFDASPGMFAVWEGESLRVSPLDYHANAHAHELFADEVAAYLGADAGLPFARLAPAVAQDE
jgi:hypothetical protein